MKHYRRKHRLRLMLKWIRGESRRAGLVMRLFALYYNEFWQQPERRSNIRKRIERVYSLPLHPPALRDFLPENVLTQPYRGRRFAKWVNGGWRKVDVIQKLTEQFLATDPNNSAERRRIARRITYVRWMPRKTPYYETDQN